MSKNALSKSRDAIWSPRFAAVNLFALWLAPFAFRCLPSNVGLLERKANASIELLSVTFRARLEKLPSRSCGNRATRADASQTA